MPEALLDRVPLERFASMSLIASSNEIVLTPSSAVIVVVLNFAGSCHFHEESEKKRMETGQKTAIFSSRENDYRAETDQREQHVREKTGGGGGIYPKTLNFLLFGSNRPPYVLSFRV